VKALHIGIISVILGLIGCGGGASSPSLVGTWVLDGAVPPPNMNQTFEFTRLAFGSDATLKAVYVPQPNPMVMMAGPAARTAAFALQHETLSYTDRGGGKLEFVESGHAATWTYEIRDGKLYLTPPPGSLVTGATVFKKEQ
jgi:hypothetical protein